MKFIHSPSAVKTKSWASFVAEISLLRLFYSQKAGPRWWHASTTQTDPILSNPRNSLGNQVSVRQLKNDPFGEVGSDQGMAYHPLASK
ncbi:MAG: hypothetical protein Q8K34_11135 [Hydrogenophaga sp.]|nr:hypothetical protein [Hydrogenophaga sp.]MDP2220737.1 hypothetical protein [Hydrogenophaga sp.]MDP3923202.1 hypothetical protein [Hydrogenophaga sp.]MDZ4238596.1 hypothetical protein [Hydrogenophaga sp.]